MDERRENVLSESARILSKLQLLAAFFSDDIIYNIYLRSQVIHQLFAQNTELDINKLELFHVQFTDTLIDLLKKIKKANEKNVILLFNEIDLNRDVINRLEADKLTKADFDVQKQRQALKINTSLRRLYEVLSGYSNEYPYSKNINAFSARFSPAFYHDVSEDVLAKLISYSPADVYDTAHAVIQRKLMGQLCKYDFKTEFLCGLKAGSLLMEVFKFTEAAIYYLYYPSRNLFLLCDAAEMELINAAAGGQTTDNSLVYELKNKNDQLQSRAALVKTLIPPGVKQLLAEHYKKITDIGFLQNISNFDAQANILKTMLNTDMM
jgi:hypothetical protein